MHFPTLNCFTYSGILISFTLDLKYATLSVSLGTVWICIMSVHILATKSLQVLSNMNSIFVPGCMDWAFTIVFPKMHHWTHSLSLKQVNVMVLFFLFSNFNSILIFIVIFTAPITLIFLEWPLMLWIKRVKVGFMQYFYVFIFRVCTSLLQVIFINKKFDSIT